MEIFEYYQKRIQDTDYFNTFFSSSLNASGSIYNKIIGTNFRSISTFYSTIFELMDEFNKPREKWKKMDNGQEVNKHRVKRFEEAGFIRKNSISYSLSNKGYSLVDSINRYNDTKARNKVLWLITLLLIMNSCFGDKSSYLFRRTMQIKQILEEVGYNEQFLVDSLREIIYSTGPSFDHLVGRDMFWLLSFIDDEAFLETFKNSPDHSKIALIFKVRSSFATKDKTDLLARKYAPGSVKSVSQFKDEAKMFYYSLFLTDFLKKGDLNDLFALYCENEHIDASLFDGFLKNNKSTIKMVLDDLIKCV